MIVKILLAGWVILFVAILLNIIAVRLGITTWYPFIENIGKTDPIKSFVNLTLISKLFIFLIYPGLLGACAYLFFRNIK